jgi:hypothetical protein
MMTGMVRSRDIIILSSIIEVVVSASAKNHAVEFSKYTYISSLREECNKKRIQGREPKFHFHLLAPYRNPFNQRKK